MKARVQLERELAAAGDPGRAANSARFFKTGEGQYGAGDVFLGINVPTQRKIALRYTDLTLTDIEALLRSKIHEHRFAAVEILVAQYKKGSPVERLEIYKFYLSNAKRVNNWDLVDTSAPYILGAHLVNARSRKILRTLAKSKGLWERRIAIVATFGLMATGETADTYQIAELLLGDKHDLIHKAVGWALREAGKRSTADLVQFLKEHYKRLPRTTLRYAIERFSPAERERCLMGDFDPR